MKKLFALILAAVLCVCGICAFGESEKAPLITEADGRAVYTIYVVDQNGDPVEGVMLNMCDMVCIPGFTNAEGFYSVTADACAYVIHVLTLPEGYSIDPEFEAVLDTNEMTITVTKDA